jgi:hypothetical protein
MKSMSSYKNEENFFLSDEIGTLFSSLLGLFQFCSELCGADIEDTVIRKTDEKPSKLLLEKSHKAKDEGLKVPKGLFAKSFERIPNDRPIGPCQFRTGHRYIQQDNFPVDSDLDLYLGLMRNMSSELQNLKSFDSQVSFDLATGEELEFQLMCDDFERLFPQLDDNMLQALETYYPTQIQYLKTQKLDRIILEEFFMFPNGDQDVDCLSDMLFYLRALTTDGLNLVGSCSQVSPKEYREFLDDLGSPCPEELPLPKVLSLKSEGWSQI